MTKRSLASYVILLAVYALTLRQAYGHKVAGWLKTKIDTGQRKRLRKVIRERLWQVKQSCSSLAYKRGYETAVADVLFLLREDKHDG